MKAVMYISQAVNKGIAPWMPYDYANLTKTTRANNELSALTGFLCYQDGFFLQYLEGSSDPVDRLMARISADPRHRNIEQLFNHDIARRNFSKWSMPMGNKLRKDDDFSRFAARLPFDLSSLSPATRDILGKFYDF